MKGTKKYRAAKAATAVGLHITISGMKITARAIAGTVSRTIGASHAVPAAC